MSKQPARIWIITVFSSVSRHPIAGINYSDERSWGFYTDKDVALQALHENWTDMWEYCYRYAVLECYEEGTIAEFIESQWFEFDQGRKGYFEIDPPGGIPDTYGIVLG